MEPQHEKDIREAVALCPERADAACGCELIFSCHDARVMLDEIDRLRAKVQECQVVAVPQVRQPVPLSHYRHPDGRWRWGWTASGP